MFKSGKRPRYLSAATWNSRWAGKQAFIQVAADGYLSGTITARVLLAHRIAWAIYHGEEPDRTIDHINGDRADNRICNLRLVPMVENARNLSLRKDNKYGHMGIWKRPEGGSRPWRACIKVNYRQITLGYFATKEEAIAARKAAELNYGFHPMTGKVGRGYRRR